MHKKELRTVLFIVLEVVILVATIVVLAPVKWPKMGTLQLAVSFSDSGQQKTSAPLLRISGKNGTGGTFGPSVVPFGDFLSFDDIGTGVWDLTVEALDDHGTVVASSHPGVIHIKHGERQPVFIILEPVWTGSFTISLHWPTDLGSFSRALLSWDGGDLSVVPSLVDDRYVALFTGQGLPVGNHTFTLTLSNGQGGTVTVPSIDSFRVSGASLTHEATINLSEFGILPDVKETTPLQPVTISLESGMPQHLVLTSPDKGVAMLYRYATDDKVLPETWTEGCDIPLPVISSSLKVEAKTVRGDCSSPVTVKQYAVAESPVYSLPEGIYHASASLKMQGTGVLVSLDGQPFVPYEGPIPINHDGMSIQSYAREDDLIDSPLVSATYHLQVEQPIITYDDEKVRMTCPTKGASIHYTTEGNLPTEASPLYSEPFSVSSSTTFRAVAFHAGMQDSPMSLLAVTLPREEEPTITMEDGRACLYAFDPQAVIHYRYALGEGAFSSWQTGSSFAVAAGDSLRIEAYVEAPGAESSPLATVWFPSALPPEFLLDNEVFDHPFFLSLQGEGTCYLSFEGSTYEPYVNPILIDRNMEVKAYTRRAGQVDSLPVSRTFHIRVEKPEITISDVPDGTKQVSISCATEGALVTCTTQEGSFTYQGPFPVTEDTVLEAVAKKEGMDSSLQSLARVAIDDSFEPRISLTEGDTQEVVLACFDSDAVLWHRISEETIFTEGTRIPVSLGNPLTVEAYAKNSKGLFSRIISKVFTTLDPPLVTPDFGTFDDSVSIEMEGDGICYRIDGGDWQESDGSPLVLTQSACVDVYRHQAGCINSVMVSHRYIVSDPVTEKQESSPQAPEPTAPLSWKVGEKGPAGGIVFYDKGDYSDCWRYLEAAPADEPEAYAWGQYGAAEGALSVKIGDGMKDTLTLLDSKVDTASAVFACSHKSVTEGGVVYDDWFLPSRDELRALLPLGAKAGILDTCYWSSSGISPKLAWEGNAKTNTVGPYYKSALHAVRAIRAF